MNTLFPIFVKLDGKRCLVVGGGRVAEQKIDQLLQSRAHVTVISPDISDVVQKRISGGEIELIQRPYRSDDCEGFLLVIGATNNTDVNRKVYSEAYSKNIPVNIVDVPDLCTFYLGSVHKEGDLSIVVSTNGKSPTLGKVIRDSIKQQFGAEYAHLLTKLGKMRPTVFDIAHDYETRKAIFKDIVEKELVRLHASTESKTRKDISTEKSHDQRYIEDFLKQGKVFLVGAGPGDPDLITVKGLNAIKQADVILYDYLIDARLLAVARPDTECIFVGKKCGKFTIKQEKINKLLITKAREGKNVVRLKGGDPFVFGRGGEEAEALFNAGIEFEVIPGVTAAIAAPAYAGIPVTHRDYSSSFALVTGHKSKSGKNSFVDWKALATGIDTVAIYMGVMKLKVIAEKFVKYGRCPDTPVAVIQSGTFSHQKTVTGTLDTIAENVKSDPVKSPAVIIIGEVVRLRSKLKWFEKQSAGFGEAVASFESAGVA